MRKFQICCVFLTLFCLACDNFEEVYLPDDQRTVPEDYVPFSEDGKRWVYGEFNRIDKSDTVYYSYKTAGDTLLNHRLYRKLYTSNDADEDAADWHYIGAVRDTLMKVFFVDSGKDGERLLYDFGLQPGSRLKWYGAKVYTKFNRYGILSQGRRYRFIEAALGYDWTEGPTWIEGIGSFDTYLRYTYDPILFVTDKSGLLLKCYHGDTCIFSYRDLTFYYYSDDGQYHASDWSYWLYLND